MSSIKTGYGASLGAATVAGGPWGAVIGAVFLTGEAAYDASKEVKRETFGFQFN